MAKNKTVYVCQSCGADSMVLFIIEKGLYLRVEKYQNIDAL
jgi:predicted ATP-dependent serine protease